MSATVAGKIVDHPLDRVVDYAETYAGDHPPLRPGWQGNPSELTAAEIQRTRKIASRISNRELTWLLGRAADAPWDIVPPDAALYDADPSLVAACTTRQTSSTGIFDRMRHAASTSRS